MKYGNLKSIIASRKRTFALKAPSESFAIADPRATKYIEPSFSRIVPFEAEKPQIILISAVGATGKSALAHVLSHELQLPLMDLGKHRPVGDNSMTGLLTDAFGTEQLSDVFGSLGRGEYAVIVDGVDEGRSKTTESAFHAFLDDIARRCASSPATSFVLLGRTQILEECWLHFAEKGINTGLVSISPFDVAQASAYIDEFSGIRGSPQFAQYVQARDGILKQLSSAFREVGSDSDAGSFTAFIGYPPVLDSIVTLLREERNFQKLVHRMGESEVGDLETELLYKIATYILDREKGEKVDPNIVDSLVRDFGAIVAPISERIFDKREQCARVVCHCLGVPMPLTVIEDDLGVNGVYEQQIGPFLVEHPFVMGRQFRNPIFEAIAVSELIISNDPRLHEIAESYLESRKHSHYLVYLLSFVSSGKRIPVEFLGSLLGSALEFRSPGASVEISVTARGEEEASRVETADIEIELSMGSEKNVKRFSFVSQLPSGAPIYLGNRLSCAEIAVPCDVVVGGSGEELELIAPIDVSAACITLNGQTMVLRASQAKASSDGFVNLEGKSLESRVSTLVNSGAVALSIALEDVRGVRHPLIQFTKKGELPTKDPLVREKYLRLRKILTHFRSHSKGALAKFRHKVENPRVAGNPIGMAVLNRLVEDGILYLEEPLYFLNPEKVDKYLGISWPELRKGDYTQKTLDYLVEIS